ncbi:YkgJ family cysteine cluster protein [Sandaracinus amylolyticus]|uniref:DUF3109 family protein n=1 Tax=Sandaracinus amylolyticus TaxID=927083 RepID=A0A0F6YPI3_9BACT|nr:DUF3109 family protein [Sandaracinus amylolyticus]AKF11503.1 hypothetical protein DB32_008652 [Sandaracinus amylolyticus]
MKKALPVVNGDAARFECVWPGCGGACCKDSRPPVSEGEAARIAEAIPRVVARLRPAARRVVERGAWVTKRMKHGRPMLAIADAYCVFYAEGCALHVLGASEGDKNKYKPATCITFPLDRDDHDRWYVRQHGVENEQWTELACLDPGASSNRAVDSLREEIAFAERVEAGLETWRRPNGR